MGGLRNYLQRAMAPRAVVALSRLPRTPWAARKRVELYFAYDDPYAAVALPGLLRIVHARGARLSLYPLVERGIAGDPAAEQRRAYAIMDANRLAQRDGRRLSRKLPLTAGECAFLAAWTEAARHDTGSADFAAAVLEKLWFNSTGGVPREACAQLHRVHLHRDPPPDEAPWRQALARNARRLRRKGHWESPAARVGGAWYFAHERLPQIDARLAALRR